MSVAKDAGVVSLEPSSTDAQGIVYSIKLTDDEAQKLIDNDQALTLALDAANGGRLTIGEETMTLSLRNELKPNNFECYCRQGRRCAKVSLSPTFVHSASCGLRKSAIASTCETVTMSPNY